MQLELSGYTKWTAWDILCITLELHTRTLIESTILVLRYIGLLRLVNGTFVLEADDSSVLRFMIAHIKVCIAEVNSLAPLKIWLTVDWLCKGLHATAVVRFLCHTPYLE